MGKPRIILRPTPSLVKQIGQMKKLLGVYSKKKVQDLEHNQLGEPVHIQKEGIPTFLNQTRGVRTSHVTRRQFVLNRHFTEIISDVLATEFKHEIDKLGINITSIETKAWNKGVSIFYSTKRLNHDETRRKLNTLVGPLRASITERRLIGRTPLVNFVFDRTITVDQTIEAALAQVRINDEDEQKNLTKNESSQLSVAKDLGSYEQRLISKRFVAPVDMDNTMFGLDYPKLYDEVAMKLSRGRGEAARMTSNSNFLVAAKPLFQAPNEDRTELDPATRLLRMRKFIISQKQKSLNVARQQRMKEILSRESAKTYVSDEGDEADENIVPDIHVDSVGSESYYDSASYAEDNGNVGDHLGDKN